MKKPVFIIACLLIIVPCAADTFTNRKTGEVFQGYATQEKRSGKTLIRIGDKQAPEYFDLLDYNIEWNSLGRRNQIIIFPIKNAIELECETKAFENAIKSASNQGPLFILIEIDTPGGRWDLMKRYCNAIISVASCHTVAFISGGEYGGAYSAGAFIAIACDYIYMADGTAIGAATPIVISSSGVKDLNSVFGETATEKFLSADRGYIATLAEQNGRSGLLAKAMVDKDIEVLEVVEGGKTIFIASEDKKESQTVQHVWSKKGSLLTLTAVEAIQCGIANKLLNSEEEIISEFGFEEPKLVRSQDTTKAREQFEIVKIRIKDLYNDIDYLSKDVALKLSQYGTVDRLYRNSMGFNDSYYRTYDYTYAGGQNSEARKLSEQRKTLKSTLLIALEQLKLKYLGILALDKVNPDLHINREELNKEINTIDVLLKNIKANLIFDLPREFITVEAQKGR
jgi:hypothetical protein